MEPRAQLRLCTFEVATQVGRHRRLGAYRNGRVADLNFATAWYLAQTGEPDPQRLADALVPANLLDYLRAGLRAVHTAEELFLGAGPRPSDWWRLESPPPGPNGETLAYDPGGVRLLDLFGAEETVPAAATCEWELAGLMDARGCLAGYTLLIRCSRHTRFGPYLATSDVIPDVSQIEWKAQVSGREAGAGRLGRGLRPDPSLRPGEAISSGMLGSTSLQPGDVLEVSAGEIGTLRCRAAQ
jgi:hypothetical protein